MRKYTVTVYVAGYNEERELHIFDQYSASEVLEYHLGDKLNELVDAAKLDGMKVTDIVIK